MGETLGMIHFVEKFLSPCEPVKLKEQVILSQNTVVVQALDKSKIFPFERGENERQKRSHQSQATLKSHWANSSSFQVLEIILCDPQLYPPNSSSLIIILPSF